MKVNRASGDPLHRQIERQLRQQIETGVYSPRKPLPSIRRLAESLAVNHLTVRRAIGSLVAEGLLVSNAGSGTFVKERSAIGSTVALIVGMDDTDELPSKVALGARQVLSAHGVDLVVKSDHEDDQIQAQALDRLSGSGIKGALVTPFGGPAGTLAILRKALAGYPVVALPGVIPGVPMWSVTLNFEAAAHAATNHLIERGRRRIAIIANARYSTALQRIEGFRRAMGERGLPVHPRQVRPNVVTIDEARAETVELLQTEPRPDAIIYGNDYRAMAGLQAITAAGLRVPEDVAVVGCGDFQVAELAQPPLTTMGYDVVGLGRAAAEMLVEVMGMSTKERLEPRTRVLPVNLVCRRST